MGVGEPLCHAVSQRPCTLLVAGPAVGFVFHDFDHGGLMTSAPLTAKSLEVAIVDGLLATQGHTYLSWAREATTPARPRTVQSAMRLIDDRAEPLTTADVAEAVGVSVRCLQDGFRNHLATTPMTFLRCRRLQRAHDEFIACDPTCTSVTDVALRWGFTHLGRFAQEYRAQYGESPSTTLRSVT